MNEIGRISPSMFDSSIALFFLQSPHFFVISSPFLLLLFFLSFDMPKELVGMVEAKETADIV